MVVPYDVDDVYGYGIDQALDFCGVDRDDHPDLAGVVESAWWLVYGDVTVETLVAAGYTAVRCGPVGSADCADVERRYADEMFDGDDWPVDMVDVSRVAKDRFAKWWESYLVLCDADTGECVGPATVAQAQASLAAGETGFILVDSDGDVITSDSWAAQQSGTRKVYVR